MKKTIKAAGLALALAVLTPTFLYAAPQRSVEWKDQGDSAVVRMVKRIKHLIIKVLEGPMIPPPLPETPQ